MQDHRFSLGGRRAVGDTAGRPYNRARVCRPPIAGEQEMNSVGYVTVSVILLLSTLVGMCVYVFTYTFVCMLMKGPYEFDLKIFH